MRLPGVRRGMGSTAGEEMTPLPGTATTVVRSTGDIEVASKVLGDAYAELTLRARPDSEPFSMRLESVDLPDVQLAVLDLSAAWVRTVPYPAYTVCFPVRGRSRASAGQTCSLI